MDGLQFDNDLFNFSGSINTISHKLPANRQKNLEFDGLIAINSFDGTLQSSKTFL